MLRENKNKITLLTAFAGPNVVLQAIRDVRARHQQLSPLVVSVRISNVTMWRKEVADWAKTSKDHILLVQETHLGPAEAREASNYMHRQGFQMYGGISHPTDKGTKGGVAVLVRSHIQGRAERSHLEEGCGFEAVDVRLAYESPCCQCLPEDRDLDQHQAQLVHPR